MAKFNSGKVVATANAIRTLDEVTMFSALDRHLNCDWGDLTSIDKRTNERALKEGGRLLSKYNSPDKRAFYILTEADRSYTTILMREDY